MPWEVPPVSELRLALVHAVRSAGLPAAEAARRFGVSRKTAFKWLARHDAEPGGPAGRPLAPASAPAPPARPRTSNASSWRPATAGAGGRASSTPCSRRDGPRRPAAADHRRDPRAATAAPGPPPPSPARRRSGSNASPPNELWQLDFKGPLEVARRRVTPLSVLDDHSRYLLGLRPCTDMTFATVQAALWEPLRRRRPARGAALRQRLRGPQQRRRPVELRRLADPPGHPPDPRPALPPADPGQGRAVPRHARGRALAARPPRQPRALRRRPGGLAAGLQRDAASRGPAATSRRSSAGGPATRRRPDRVPEATYPAGSTCCGGSARSATSATGRRGSWWAGAWPASRCGWRSGGARSEVYYCTRAWDRAPSRDDFVNGTTHTRPARSMILDSGAHPH